MHLQTVRKVIQLCIKAFSKSIRVSLKTVSIFGRRGENSSEGGRDQSDYERKGFSTYLSIADRFPFCQLSSNVMFLLYEKHLSQRFEG